jgi:PAS domain-containing protein
MLDIDAYLERRVPHYERLHRMKHRNGHYIWVLVRGMALWDQQGKPTRFIGTHVEMTAQKQAEDALRNSQRSLAEAQRIAHLGSWEWEVQTDRLIWSDEVYRIFGVQPSEFKPSYSTFLSLVHSDDVAALQQAVNDALQRKGTYAIDYRIILPNHEIHFVHEQAEVTFDEKLQSMRMVGTVQDITERKQNEIELLHAKNAADVANQAKTTYPAQRYFGSYPNSYP